jgi:uncharacterized repeat protein (TIGR03803 family)
MTRLEKWCWVLLFCAATTIVSPAQAFKTLASFNYYDSGAYPQYMYLIQDSEGSLFGTTPEGGFNWGTVFQVTPAGDLSPLYYFGGGGFGANPYAGLVQADGNFYGTIWQGGPNGAGGIYELTQGGTLTLLYSFCSLTDCTDGGDPYGTLIQASDGKFYGTTSDGGAKGYGTVFAMTAAGTLTTLHNFAGSDGASPVAGLIQGKNGKLYGTTLYGGAHGAGTIFEISAAGKLKTLHSFGSSGDGANPYSGLVQATDGNFYGTTFGGGANGHGTVFAITAAGKLTTLYSFCPQEGCADGAHPYAGVIQATDGSFYGTTSGGGSNNWGTVFAITAAGKLTTLHSFCSKRNCADGADPSGGLIQAKNGIFYGTTAEGGIHEDGTIFSLSLGLEPGANQP